MPVLINKNRKDTERHHEQIDLSAEYLPFSFQKFHWCGRRTWQLPFYTSTVLYALDDAKLCGTQHNDQMFIEHGFVDNIIPFRDTIHENVLPLLNSRSGRTPSKSTSKISNLQNDVQLFSRMYISCQVGDSDMDASFKHENHACAPQYIKETNIGIINRRCSKRVLYNFWWCCTCEYMWQEEVPSFWQNIPVLFRGGILALHGVAAARRSSYRCCLGVYREDSLKAQNDRTGLLKINIG